MKTPETLYRTTPTIFMCELSQCPLYEGELSQVGYVNGRKTIRTTQEVLIVAYRPKVCTEKGSIAKLTPERFPPGELSSVGPIA